jgi:hypothetical protein
MEQCFIFQIASFPIVANANHSRAYSIIPKAHTAFLPSSGGDAAQAEHIRWNVHYICSTLFLARKRMLLRARYSTIRMLFGVA